MKTTRSTALAERLIVWLSVITLTWFVGYEWGQYKLRTEQTAKCLEKKTLNLYQSRKAERRWINYWKSKS